MLRVFHHYISSRKLVFFAAETAAIGTSALAGAWWTATRSGMTGDVKASWPWLALVTAGFVVTFQFALYSWDLYNLRVAALDRAHGHRLMRAAGAAVVAMGIGTALAPYPIPSGALWGGVFGALAGTLLVRAGMKSLVGKPQRVLILGQGPRSREVARAIEEEGEGFEICGVIEPPAETDRDAEEIEHVARRLNAQYLVMAMEEHRGRKWVESAFRCRVAGRRVYNAAGFSERVLRRMPISSLLVSDLAFSDEMTVSSSRRFWKRALDIVLASLVLWQALPSMLLIALAIRLDSKGPIFYQQERTGRDGKPYWLWKFRSMRTDAEKDGAVWARTGDDRVTRVGRFIRKTRMDELPQVFNVLWGEMSFVGPRPERPVFIEQIKKRVPHYALREAVKPGITGWAQIRYPYGASIEDARKKLEYDLYYVKNASLFLDVAIVFHTVRHVLFGRGAR